MMSDNKRFMTAEDINFIVSDLQGVMSCIAGHIQLKIRDNENVIELRVQTTLVAGVIAEMQDRKNKLINRREVYNKFPKFKREYL